VKGPLFVLGVLGLVMACGEGSRQAPTSRAVRETGPVVARVNGDPIGLDEVRRLCAASSLSAEQALERLVEERLLAQHAEARGYGELAETRNALLRAQVRALLEDSVEREVEGTPERRERLERLLQGLRGKTKVIYDENAVQRAMSDDSLIGSGT
jgi:hypothetical protein